MEFLDYLKNAAKSSTSVYTKFLQQYSFNSNDLHVFFEGKDDPSFYSNYIERYKRNKQRVFYYRAQNKKGVYHNYSQVDWTQYEKNRVLFLVDKDFRDILNENYHLDTNIFETKYYSIENYLVNKSMFSRCLRELLSIEDDKVINQITNEFTKQLMNFHEEIKPIISLILYFRENKLNANLNEIDLGKVFCFKNGIKRKKNIKNFLEKSMDTPIEAPWRDVLRYIRILDKIENSKYFIRGKFEIWFFNKFISSLPDILNHNRKKGEPKVKLNVNLSDSTAVQILAPRLRIPSELKVFLENNVSKAS